MSTFLGMFLKKKKKKIGHFMIGDLGMVFKPSFKCFKYLYSSDSETRVFVLSEYIYILFHLKLYSYSCLD